MRRDPLLRLLHPLWLMGLGRSARLLAQASQQPERAQAERLKRCLADNAASSYGRAHGFDQLDSVAAFQRAVPIADYDQLSPYIDRISAGEAGVLTCEPVRLMERSGGSTGAATKLIPYTASLLADFSAATNPWLFDLYRRWPRMIGTPAYWSLSPVAQGARKTAGGIPIGMEDDTEYFGPVRRFVIERSLAVPGSVAKLTDFGAWRRATLHHLLSTRGLGILSVWSPTFLLVLLAALEEERDALLATLTSSRAREVRAALEEGPGAGSRIWPQLQLISCWADGPSADFIAPLARWFPGVAIQPKGLLATEGVVSVPIGEGPGALLALRSHFLEFIDLEQPASRPLLAHQLRVGGSYSPLLTTGGGLYRYHLKDVVTCTGPLRVRFVSKLDSVADLAGEKLHAGQVQRALDSARGALNTDWEFALLAPVLGEPGVTAPYYCLYIDSAEPELALAAVARHVEELLLQGHAYRYCRDLGQLGPLRVQRVRDGRARYLLALVAQGQRAGDVKSAVLDARPLWAGLFGPGDQLPTESRAP